MKRLFLQEKFNQILWSWDYFSLGDTSRNLYHISILLVEVTHPGHVHWPNGQAPPSSSCLWHVAPVKAADRALVPCGCHGPKHQVPSLPLLSTKHPWPSGVLLSTKCWCPGNVHQLHSWYSSLKSFVHASCFRSSKRSISIWASFFQKSDTFTGRRFQAQTSNNTGKNKKHLESRNSIGLWTRCSNSWAEVRAGVKKDRELMKVTSVQARFIKKKKGIFCFIIFLTHNRHLKVAPITLLSSAHFTD